MPLQWATMLLGEANCEGRVKSAPGYAGLLGQVLDLLLIKYLIFLSEISSSLQSAKGRVGGVSTLRTNSLFSQNMFLLQEQAADQEQCMWLQGRNKHSTHVQPCASWLGAVHIWAAMPWRDIP